MGRTSGALERDSVRGGDNGHRNRQEFGAHRPWAGGKTARKYPELHRHNERISDHPRQPKDIRWILAECDHEIMNSDHKLYSLKFHVVALY